MSEDSFGSVLMAAWNGQLELTRLIDQGNALEQASCVPLAAILYQTWLKKTPSPLAHLVWFNLGAILSNLGDLVGAEEAYRQAISLNPGFIQPRLNLGLVFERQGLLDKAIEEWMWVDRNVAPDSAEFKPFVILALNHLGRVLETRKEYRDAEAYLARSLSLDALQADVLHHWVYLRQKQCSWPIYVPVGEVSADFMEKSTSALAMIALTDDPVVQLASARRFADKKVLKDLPPLSRPSAYGHGKIRIGYCSSDFCLHPVSMLMVELFELHDRENFEIFGYCWSPEDGSDMRKRVIGAMDHFQRIHALSEKDAAQLIRSHEIDILIDLQGQTAGARMNMLAYRPAPIQITYLGLPATTGLASIDYVIADRFLIPEEEAGHYSEKPLYMPDVYQVSDRNRRVGPTPSRASCGLPENAFVFCSFNNNFKYTPEMFSIWMNILRRVDDSVLWLLADNAWAESNLRREAIDRGIDPTRLVFASRVSPENYLARYLIADLFLDSFPFNAGTTANDALWMGLPVLTRSGRTFASRMAGALLTAARLADMIVYNLTDYEEKAVRLGTERSECRRMREHLGLEKATGKLFDTPAFTRNLEAALQGLVNALPTLDTENMILPVDTDIKHQTSDDRAVLPVAPASRKLLVEGWRGINHSFAIVNQFQLFELLKQPDIALYHTDVPVFFSHWNRTNNGVGFDEADEALLAGIPGLPDGTVPDWTYRIFSPLDLRAPQSGGRLAVFMVTEFGLDEKSFSDGSDIKRFESEGGVIVTPSQWSKDRIIDFGFQPDGMKVIPHAASSKYFHSLPIEVTNNQRKALGFGEGEVILLNVGAAIWNKGIDVLLQAFAIARQSRKDLRLVFKDQRNTYGISGDNFVQTTLAGAGLLTSDVLQAITLIPSNLTMNQMNSMYGLADCYVSPYRAEGFNLPVCEAMACGTPVAVTSGGATDDFVPERGNFKIESVLQKNVMVQGTKISAYCEPSLDHLVQILLGIEAKQRGRTTAVQEREVMSGWQGPVGQLLHIFQ